MNRQGLFSGKLPRYVLENIGRSQFNQDVLWNIGSLGILALGGVGINLVVTRFRGNEALGVFNQVYAIYIVLSQVGVGGLQFSVLKHVSHNQDDVPTCADITIAALILVAVIAGLICVGMYLLAEVAGVLLDSAGVEQGLLVAIPGLFFFALNKVLINALNGLRHMKAYAVFRSLRFILIPVSILVIIGFQLSIPYLLLSLTASEVLLFVSLIRYVHVRLFPLTASSNLRRWFLEHISFGSRGMLSGILLELNTRIDVLMLGYFSTDAIVGVYSFAATLAEGFAQIPLAIRWNVDPILGGLFAENGTGRIGEMSRKIRRVLYPIMGIMGVAAILSYPVFLNLWVVNGETATGWAVFATIMVGVLVNSGYRPFTGIILQGGRPGAYTLFIVGLVVGDAMLNLVFIPVLGVYGAAIVTGLTYVLEAVLLVICARKLFGVHL
jgi:O-antigen/teichoic acid export membrane protein